MSIASEISRLQSDSSAIATAIAAKGVTVPSGSGYDDYANLIASIETGGGGGGSLPYDSEVEYIAGNGTQYINTGIVPTFGSTSVFIDCQFTANSSSTQVIVAHGSASLKWFGNASSYYCVATNTTGKSTVAALNRSPFLIYYETNKRVDFSNGYRLWYFSSNTAITATTPITIFCADNDYFSSAKVFAFKIYTGQTLSMDLIPVRVGTEGRMYDRVSGNFFTNAGSGAFLYGPDI